MSQSIAKLIISKIADAAILANRFVKLTSTGIAAATAGTDKIAGVMNKQEGVATGEIAPVVVFGTAKVVASAAVAIGDAVTATTGGKAVVTTTTGNIVRGIALEAAAADGDIIEILLTFYKY